MDDTTNNNNNDDDDTNDNNTTNDKNNTENLNEEENLPNDDVHEEQEERKRGNFSNCTIEEALASPEEKKDMGYGRPLPQHESDAQKRKTYSIRATKRILAPFVKARHKPKTKAPDNKYFSFYVQKKPSILMRDMTTLLLDGVDFISVLNETADVLKEATNSTSK